MASNLLVINCDLRETRVALIENGVIAELHIERASRKGTVGNVVLGRVTRVLPGMQAAFIDVGAERAAFLHVEDLIRPDDFEDYLLTQSDTRVADDDDGRTTGGKTDSSGKTDDDDGEEDDSDDDDDGEEDDSDDDGENGEEDDGENGEEDDSDDDGDGKIKVRRRRVVTSADKKLPKNDDGEASNDDEASDDDDENGEEDERDDDDEASDGDQDDEPGNGEDSDDESPADDERDDDASRAEDTSKGDEGRDDDASAKRRGRRRRGGRGRRSRSNERASDRDQDQDQDQGKRGTGRSKRRGDDKRGRGGRNKRNGKQSRIQRSVPITEVVKEGDEVVVQISKEPIGTKGARVTSHVTLPGRYVVYLPTVEHVGVSKRIGSSRERTRLRKVIDQFKPPKGGLIVRTVAEGLTKKQLKTDVGYLIKVWEEVSAKHKDAKPCETLYEELGLVLKTARDQFTDEIDKIIIDDKDQYHRLVRFMEMFLPDRVGDIELYSGDEPIFDAYGIEDEISRALSRKVPLPSGGYLIIDQAEALTAIDVNTGRFVGKGSKDLEETALKTNLEAVDEIAYQLRFRNIGGLVILDLIDMDKASNRNRVLRALEQKLAKDKAKTTLQRISELGLVEMTRKRTRESLGRLLHEPCFYCDGTGQIQSRETIGYEILRQIRRERQTLAGYSVTVNAHPAICDLLQNEEKEAVAETERRLMRRIEFVPRKEYHIEQFDLQGR